MENSNLPKNRIYLRVPEPWHFRVRPDLIEELCLADRMAYALPGSRSTYTLWRQLGGQESWHAPFSEMKEHLELGYLPTTRWVFGIVMFPGDNQGTPIAMDARGWWTQCPWPGLLLFVFRRAVECLATYGYTSGDANKVLVPRPRPKNPSRDEIVYPRCYLGYETGTGLCQIVQPALHEGLRRFLQSAPDAVPLKIPMKRKSGNGSGV